jgi:two-component system, sensor histidine kinase and response regulator
MKQEATKVLIVDDVPENLIALEALLRRDGVQSLAARAGAEALELLLVHDVAIALVDVQMPEMDGFELAELMRGNARTKHVPIIFITAGASDPTRVFRGYESGAVDFLYKPIDARILKAKIDVFLELADQRRQITHALRLHELFVAILGHDLRNPLGAMLAGTELLAHQLTDDRHQRTLSQMGSAGRRMTAMIEQLLDLTRARLGDGVGFVRSHKPLDVRELVQHTLDELRASHGGRDIAFDAAGDCASSGDPERLLQLFSNVIANALAHGEAGSAIAVRVVGGSRDIVVEVSNRGAIPPERLATLFEPFRRERRPAARASSHGLGLGLFISRQIALAHGGDIEVASSPAAGTSVVIRLPRTGETAADATADASIERPGYSTTGAASGARAAPSAGSR